MTETAERNLPFEHLGEYDVLAPIAEGGMASVWLGRRTAQPTELVALKVIRAEYGRNKDFVAMLVDEAGIASRLFHPNIVSVRALGHEGKQHFLVMELLRGHTLLEILECRSRAGQAAAARGRRVDWRSRRRRAPLRARARRREGKAAERRAPRRQPREHLRHKGRHSQAHRLRARAGERSHRVDGHRCRQGQARVPRARAGARAAGRPPLRRLRARRDAVGAHARPALVPRRQRRPDSPPRARGPGARPGEARGGLSAQAGGSSRARAGARAGRPLADRRAATRRARRVRREHRPAGRSLERARSLDEPHRRRAGGRVGASGRRSEGRSGAHPCLGRAQGRRAHGGGAPARAARPLDTGAAAASAAHDRRGVRPLRGAARHSDRARLPRERGGRRQHRAARRSDRGHSRARGRRGGGDGQRRDSAGRCPRVCRRRSLGPVRAGQGRGLPGLARRPREGEGHRGPRRGGVRRFPGAMPRSRPATAPRWRRSGRRRRHATPSSRAARLLARPSGTSRTTPRTKPSPARATRARLPSPRAKTTATNLGTGLLSGRARGDRPARGRRKRPARCQAAGGHPRRAWTPAR